MDLREKSRIALSTLDKMDPSDPLRTVLLQVREVYKVADNYQLESLNVSKNWVEELLNSLVEVVDNESLSEGPPTAGRVGGNIMQEYRAEYYNGRAYSSNQYCYRYGVQIVCTEGGKRKKVFSASDGGKTYKTACYKMAEWCKHYKTGLNKQDTERAKTTYRDAVKLAALWSERGTHVRFKPEEK